MVLKKFTHKELILVCCIITFLSIALILLITILQHEFSRPSQERTSSSTSGTPGTQQKISHISTTPASLRSIRLIAKNDQSFFIGQPQAHVVVVEFLDFQCPFCKQMSPILQQLMREYNDKSVTFIFRHFPIITTHPFAFNSALASECARDQQAFLPMHDLLYEKQDGFNNASITTSAQELNLNLSVFNTCMADRKYQTRIVKDLSDGFDLGITGTPALYINDHVIIGATPYEELKNIIDQELRKASQQQ